MFISALEDYCDAFNDHMDKDMARIKYVQRAFRFCSTHNSRTFHTHTISLSTLSLLSNASV